MAPDLREHLIAVEEKAMADWQLLWPAGRTITPRRIAEERVDRILAAMDEAPPPERYVAATPDQLRTALDAELYALLNLAESRLETLKLHGRLMPDARLDLGDVARRCEQITRALWAATKESD
mgnify:CR=1 FL=1